MIEQGSLGSLQGQDLEDWQMVQAEVEAAEKWPDDWSQNEKLRLMIRVRMMEWRFYEAYRLTKSKVYDFHPVTGAITEVKDGILWEEDDE